MHLRDLEFDDSGAQGIKCDVCIVGAGAAGLYLARRLSQARLQVVLLEAGGRDCSPGSTVGIVPEFQDSTYAGAIEGRAFGWGGSTSRWGGVLIPHSPLDTRPGDGALERAWGHIVRTVTERTAAVMTNLGLGSAPDFFEYPHKVLGTSVESLRDNGLAIESSEFLPFRRRNLTYLMESHIGPGPRPIGLCHAVAASWSVKEGTAGHGVMASVIARSSTGRTVTVSAQHFVIAAGALEAARILLEIDRQTGERMFPRTAAIGKYLSDHLSCPVGLVARQDWARAAKLFGPRFSRGRMRAFRFIEMGSGPDDPRHFAHFLFKNENPGFVLAKEMLSRLQQRRFPRVSLGNVLKGGMGLCALAWHRFVREDLYIPGDTETCLQLDIEQMPSRSNAISLGAKTDQYGRAVSMINWRVTDGDLANIERIASRVLTKWPARSLGMSDIRAVPPGDGREKPHDAYHPVGCTRMGSDDEAVVDSDLRARGTQNLWVASTSVFPTAGTANPTFSMLCLADKLCDTLICELRPKVGVH